MYSKEILASVLNTDASFFAPLRMYQEDLMIILGGREKQRSLKRHQDLSIRSIKSLKLAAPLLKGWPRSIISLTAVGFRR